MSAGPEDFITDPEHAGLGELISASAREIGRLADLGHRLQTLIGSHVATAGSGESAVEDAQLIDELVQHLEAMEAFLDRLAGEAPRGCEVDLTAAGFGLRLGGLLRRLAGRAAHAGGLSGDMELL